MVKMFVLSEYMTCCILCVLFFFTFANYVKSVYMEHFYSYIDNTLFSTFVYFCEL